MNKYNIFSFILIFLISFSSFNVDISTIEFYEKGTPILNQILQSLDFNKLIALAKQDEDEFLKEQAQKTLLIRWHMTYNYFMSQKFIPAFNKKRHLVLEKIANHNFSECDAEATTFYKCEFNNCNFTNAKMQCIELIQCNFTNCDFSGSGLNNANIKKATIAECKFDNAKMGQINIYKSMIKNCTFKGEDSYLANAIFNESTILDTDFEKADFCGAEITRCALQNAQFISCSFLRAFITDSKLQRVSFNKALLSYLTLDKNDFFEVDISEAHLNPINFNEQKIIFRSLQRLRDMPGLFWQNNKEPILIQQLGKRSEEKDLPSSKR